MYGTSEALRELLARQGMTNGRAGTRADGPNKGRGAASDGARSQLRQREETADLNSGEKGATAKPRQFTGRERQNSARMGREPFPGCVADIVDEMPTRKGARPTLFLVCIDGVLV